MQSQDFTKGTQPPASGVSGTHPSAPEEISADNSPSPPPYTRNPDENRPFVKENINPAFSPENNQHIQHSISRSYQRRYSERGSNPPRSSSSLPRFSCCSSSAPWLALTAMLTCWLITGLIVWGMTALLAPTGGALAGIVIVLAVGFGLGVMAGNKAYDYPARNAFAARQKNYSHPLHPANQIRVTCSRP